MLVVVAMRLPHGSGPVRFKSTAAYALRDCLAIEPCYHCAAAVARGASDGAVPPCDPVLRGTGVARGAEVPDPALGFPGQQKGPVASARALAFNHAAATETVANPDGPLPHDGSIVATPRVALVDAART